MDRSFKIPEPLKILLQGDLKDEALNRLKVPDETLEKLKKILISTRAVLENGPTKNNYMMYFHYLLWWEEIFEKIELRKYNMRNVEIKHSIGFSLEVPSLAQKKPSLVKGNRIAIVPKPGVRFESQIVSIEGCRILLSIKKQDYRYFLPGAKFNVHFLYNGKDSIHEAVSRLYSSRQDCRVFPEICEQEIPVAPIGKFFNSRIARNAEQKSAVEHIVAGSSGLAPYIVFGPPGTGKTVTIVEAIIQLVVRNPRHRIMVCADSNNAADNIALMLINYDETLNIDKFLIRAISMTRERSSIPDALDPYVTTSIKNRDVSKYRIFVTTLIHAAKYASDAKQSEFRLKMTHLFIDEAAQATEPAALVPVVGLLAPAGRLVLAGDPRQLGPVCVSREAAQQGLGLSLLERLKQTHNDLYTNPNYITMLVRNFRSNPDILAIPNELFYGNSLLTLAPLDPLSNKSILDHPAGKSAVVFHAVHSRERRSSISKSYSNTMEIKILKKYTEALIQKHYVNPEDIGIIAPYLNQVSEIKVWLAKKKLNNIEVGTVEIFQGKEKRVILVTTVRGKGKCLNTNTNIRKCLGFLVDDKRFNVILTRAKAKLIIIGNPSCLSMDVKWRKYIEFCKTKNCYLDDEEIEINSQVLLETATKQLRNCKIGRPYRRANPFI